MKINGDPKDNNAALFKEGSNASSTTPASRSPRSPTRPTGWPRTRSARWSRRSRRVGKDGFAGVYAANDGTAGGAIAALKGAGIDPATVPVTGQDAELAGIQRVLDGEQFMTVYKPIKPLAESAAELAVALANGEEPPEGLINGEEDNGTEQVPTVFLETVAVTADNVQDTIIADDFWSVDEICTADSTRRRARRRASSRDPCNDPDARGEAEMMNQATETRRADSSSEPLLALKGFHQELRRRRGAQGGRLRAPPRRGRRPGRRQRRRQVDADQGDRRRAAGRPRRGEVRRQRRSRSRARRPRPASGSPPSTRTSPCARTSTWSPTSSSARRSRAVAASSTRRRWSRSRSSCSTRSG